MDEHKVGLNDGNWVVVDAKTADAAREVEKRLLADGCTGDTGGGDHESRFVYAYLKNSQTQP